MRSRNTCHAQKDTIAENAPKNDDRKMRKFWRELARLITLFDEASPAKQYSSGRNRRIL
jgi:hypothetical protein